MRVAPILLALAGLAAQSLPEAASFRFHHLHLNDPKLLDFYARLFDPASISRPTVAGFNGLRAGPMLLLFARPGQPGGGSSAIWHFGWGAVSVGETYLDHAAAEVVWEPPLPAGRLHLHLLSRAPSAAAAWYGEIFNARVETRPGAAAPTRIETGRAELRVAEGAVHFGEFSMLIYRTTQTLASSRGHTADHVALESEKLDEVIARLRARHVPILEAPKPFGDTRAALVEGPDKIAIEIIEASPRAPNRD